jgi:hypothetical protein
LAMITYVYSSNTEKYVNMPVQHEDLDQKIVYSFENEKERGFF